MPTPRPLARSAASRVENPGAQRMSRSSSLLSVPVRDGQALLTSAARHGHSVDAAAVVADLHDHRVADGRSAEREQAFVGLARGAALGGVSSPWLTALRTRCRIGSIIRSIRNLSISVSCPAISSRTFLSARPGRGPRTACDGKSPRPAPCGPAPRLPADPAGGDRWPGCFPGRPATRPEAHAARRAPANRQPRPGDDQIADETHQLVEPRQVDADEMRRRSREATEGPRCRSDGGVAGVLVRHGRGPLDRDTLIAPISAPGSSRPVTRNSNEMPPAASIRGVADVIIGHARATACGCDRR